MQNIIIIYKIIALIYRKIYNYDKVENIKLCNNFFYLTCSFICTTLTKLNITCFSILFLNITKDMYSIC